MADRLRIVNLRWPKPPAVLADLSAAGQLRDTFKITPGDTGAALSASTARWDGQRIVSERRGNATVALTMLVTAATPNAAIGIVQNALENALQATLPDLAIEWRPDGATYSEFWRVRGPASYAMNYSWAEFFSANLLKVDVSFPVAPLAEGAPYDIADDFTTDTIVAGDWIKDAGTASMSVVGGALAPSAIIGAGVEMRYRHARGYSYGDVEVGLKITTGSTLTNGRWCVTIGDDSGGVDTGITLLLIPTGYSVWGYNAGTPTTISGPVALTVTANTTYYLQLRRAGNVLYWRVTTALNYNEWAIEPNSVVLTGGFLRWSGPGQVGFKVSAADTAERVDDFYARPFTYKQIQSPEHMQLLGPIVGDAPALADVEVMPIVGASSSPAIFGMVAWCDRPQIQNLCYAGNFTTVKAVGGGTYGWSVGAVAGVMGAASSYLRAAGTVPKYGSNALEVVCPATTDTGANFLLTRRFKKGKLYAAWGWMAAASGTTQARCKLGVSGDLTTENAQNLSVAPKLHAVTWQPTADRDSAYLAFGISNATLTTFDVSGINVVEAPMVTISNVGGISSGATSMTVYNTPSDVPGLNPDGTLSQAFLALIDLELVLVTAISGLTWTISRGAEGSTAATHAQDAFVVCCPPSRQQFEGKGAHPCFGVIEGEMFAADRQAATPTTGNTDYRGGGYVTATASGGGLDFYVDPSSILPDDFSQGDVLVEVWARMALDPAGTGVVINASAVASETYDPDTALASLAGVPRYTLEYGSSGFAPPAPTGTGGTVVPVFMRLGTLPLVADRTRPQRSKIRITPTYSGGVAPRIDYLLVTPVRYRASTQTGKSTTDPTYATFVPNVVSANAVAKVLRADGSALLRVPRIGAYLPPEPYPDSGLGHSIAFPSTDTDLLVKLSNLVPNDPGAQATEMFATQPFWTIGAHAAITPRFAAARGS